MTDTTTDGSWWAGLKPYAEKAPLAALADRKSVV